MQCCAAVRATSWKQQTPQLWMKESGEGGAGVHSFVLCGYTLFEYNVSTIEQMYTVRKPL